MLLRRQRPGSANRGPDLDLMVLDHVARDAAAMLQQQEEKKMEKKERERERRERAWRNQQSKDDVSNSNSNSNNNSNSNSNSNANGDVDSNKSDTVDKRDIDGGMSSAVKTKEVLSEENENENKNENVIEEEDCRVVPGTPLRERPPSQPGTNMKHSHSQSISHKSIDRTMKSPDSSSILHASSHGCTPVKGLSPVPLGEGGLNLSGFLLDDTVASVVDPEHYTGYEENKQDQKEGIEGDMGFRPQRDGVMKGRVLFSLEYSHPADVEDVVFAYLERRFQTEGYFSKQRAELAEKATIVSSEPTKSGIGAALLLDDEDEAAAVDAAQARRLQAAREFRNQLRSCLDLDDV